MREIRMMLWYKKKISKFDKIVAPFFLLLAIASVVLGIAGIVDGVKSQLSGGYGDNIVLGTMILLFMPLLCVAAFLAITDY